MREAVVSAPIEYATTRYRCQHCRKSYAHAKTATKHMAQCFRNPEVRSCKTCRHYEYVRSCDLGVDLDTARCATCGGLMYPDGSGECECPGDGGRPVYGLRVRCDKWEVDRG